MAILVATRELKHRKFTVLAGMPIPHQRHSGFVSRLKDLYGEDCVKLVDNVSLEMLKKVQLENELLRKENARFKAQASGDASTEALEALKLENESLSLQVAKLTEAGQALEADVDRLKKVQQENKMLSKENARFKAGNNKRK